MRRLAPRPLEVALARVTEGLAPPTTLARVQGVWGDAVGERLGREARPVSERAGTVTVACRDSVWAHELNLMSAELVDKLNDALERSGAPRSTLALRVVVGS